MDRPPLSVESAFEQDRVRVAIPLRELARGGGVDYCSVKEEQPYDIEAVYSVSDQESALAVGETDRPGVRSRPVPSGPPYGHLRPSAGLSSVFGSDADPRRDPRAGAGPPDPAASGEDPPLTSRARPSFVE